MDEEKDVSSSSDGEEHSGIDDLVKGANDSSDEAADFAAALPIQESMSPMDEESEDQESDKEETESSDASDSKSSDLDDKPLSDYDLSDAENYFNRQNGAIVCRRCGQAGHRGIDCPNVQRMDPCFQCAQTDHLAHDCPTTICRQWARRCGVRRSCNQEGHMTRECPARSVPPPCTHCSSRLHRADVVVLYGINRRRVR